MRKYLLHEYPTKAKKTVFLTVLHKIESLRI